MSAQSTDVWVSCQFHDKMYSSTYFRDICCGELIRNCCVNLGLDPDMEEGQIKNFIIYRVLNGVQRQWAYDPFKRIGTVCPGNNELVFTLKPCTQNPILEDI